MTVEALRALRSFASLREHGLWIHSSSSMVLAKTPGTEKHAKKKMEYKR